MGYKARSEPENCHGVEILNGSRERIQVQRVIGISLVPAGLEMKIKD